MRILMAYDSISPQAGGAQEATLRWVRNLDKLGIHIKILCDQGIFQLAEGLKPELILLSGSAGSSLLPGNRSAPLFLTNSLKKQIKEFKPDLIHIHEQLFISPQLIGFAHKLSIPVLNSFHGNSHKFKAYTFPYSLFVGEGKVVNRLLKSCQDYMLKHADFLTAPTNYYCQELEKTMHKQCSLLPYPIAHHFFEAPKRSRATVTKLLTVSRLTGEKNVHVVIEMMKYLKGKCSLTIVGDGLDKAYLEKRVKQLGIEEDVTFKGWLNNSDLPEFISNFDLFLSPSDFETFGITYIEALAVHLPCVVYDYPVAREVIPNGTAVFVPTLQPEDWASAVQKLQDQPELYAHLHKEIQKNYEYISGYEELHSTKKLMETYANLLEKPQYPSHH